MFRVSWPKAQGCEGKTDAGLDLSWPWEALHQWSLFNEDRDVGHPESRQAHRPLPTSQAGLKSKELSPQPPSLFVSNGFGGLHSCTYRSPLHPTWAFSSWEFSKYFIKLCGSYFNSGKETKVFPGGTSGKESTCRCRRHRDAGSIPGSGQSPGGGNGNPLQCSCLENAIDRGPWWATVHGITEVSNTSEHSETKTAVETPSTVNKPPAFCLAGLSKASPGGHRRAHTSLRSSSHTLTQSTQEGGSEAHCSFQVAWSLKPGTFSLTQRERPHGVF